MPTLTTTEQKNLRFFARSRLGLNDNASIKTIVKTLNDPSVNVNNFYSKMKKFQEEEEKAFVMEEARKRDVEFAKKIKEEIVKKQVKKEKAKAKRKQNEKKKIMNGVIVFKPEEVDDAEIKFYDLLKSKMGKNIIFEIVSNGINETFNYEIPVEQKEFSRWYKAMGVWIIRSDSSTMKYDLPEGANMKVFLYESKIVNKPVQKLKQYFKEGTINCLLKPILEWCENKYEEASSKSAKSRYNVMLKDIQNFKNEFGDNGVEESDICRICDILQIDISIEKPLICNEQTNKYVFEAKSNKKPLKHFILRNTRVDHTDLNEYTYLNNIEFVDREQLNKIIEECDETKIYATYTKDLSGYNSISTLEKTYKLNNEFSEMCNNFEIETGLNECYIDYINDNELSKFVINSVHYNGTIDFKNIEDFRFNREGLNHYDMETAYTQFKQCSFYKGFLGKITDFRSCDKIEGVGIYKIKDITFTNQEFKELNDKMNIYIDNCEYPSVELDYLTSMGCAFNIVAGCWGVKSLDFEFPEEMFKKYDNIRAYSKYVGKCNSIYKNKKYWIKGSNKLADIIKDNELGNVERFENGEICLSYPKKNVFHLSQLTSFIVSYQRIQVLQQLIKMNKNNLVRVCVDGIYYLGEEEFNYPFVDKCDKMNLGNNAGESYISNNWGIDDISFANKREHNSKELHLGEGGNGKTHFNLLDRGLCRILYVAPSHKLASKKRDEYNVNCEVWANILTSDVEKINKIKKYYNTLIIDECSMMEELSKQFIFKTYDNMKLIFCGDVGFQAPPFSKDKNVKIEEIKQDGFKVIQYNTNYRFKCDKLKYLVYEIRRFIRGGMNDYFVNQYVINQLGFVNDSFVKENYKIEDMILSRSHEIKDKYTEMFKDMNKWYITKNSRYLHNGDIVIGDKPNKDCEIRHSYTIHSIQGETANHKLFINMDKVYDSRLLYTAISRAKYLDQIIIVKN